MALLLGAQRALRFVNRWARTFALGFGPWCEFGPREALVKTNKWFAAMLVSTLMAGMVFAQPARSETVKVYAAAVAKSPLTALAAQYEKTTGNKVTLVFDTAGATDTRFRADPEAALLITTVPLIRNGQNSGALKDGVSVLLGSTVAGVVVPPKSRKPDISSPEKLKAALIAAKRIAVSDTARGATVGTHFMKVIEGLGIKDQVLAKTTLANDGVETVHLVLDGKADIGVSQSSEILQGSPDAFAGPFPAEFALATEFSLWHRNAISQATRDFVALLTGPSGRKQLAADGVMPPAAR
jgi:molybdate transport system substrate-binding protein